MKIMYPDYSNGPANLANSILKYFDCRTFHTTNQLVDEVLERKQYKNVILYLCDGMGKSIIEEHLPEDSFLRKHYVNTISSVFPPTTTASTTTITTGLEPCEHGWLGWDLYFEEEDDIITMFRNFKKDTEIPAAEYDVAETKRPIKKLYEQILEQSDYHGEFLFPFRYTKYDSIEHMHQIILDRLNMKEKNFIYAYDTQPDSLMHEKGCHSLEAKERVQLINSQIESLCCQLHDTLVIVTADHGHCDIEMLYLSDYPELTNLLIRDISIESRATTYFVKEGCQEQFKKLFHENFGDDFMLLTHDEVVEKKLFGEGTPCEKFESSIGDFMSIALTDKAIFTQRFDDGFEFKSHHAGLTSDEMEIPLILIECD